MEIKAFPTFLLTAVRYQLYSRAKSIRLSLTYKADHDELNDSSTLNSGEVRIREIELQKELDECLSQLPKRCYQIFYLSRMEHLSNQDIADRLGVSKKPVENQLTVALKHLRFSFKNIGGLLLFFTVFKL